MKFVLSIFLCFVAFCAFSQNRGQIRTEEIVLNSIHGQYLMGDGTGENLPAATMGQFHILVMDSTGRIFLADSVSTALLDSLYTCDTGDGVGVGFVIMGDSICISTDSIFFADDCVYGVQMGDTVSVCVDGEGGGVNIGNSNLQYTNTDGQIRILNQIDAITGLHATTSFRRGSALQFDINRPGLGSLFTMYNEGSSTPVLKLSNAFNPTFDLNIVFQGTQANETYSTGLDDSEDAWVLGEGGFLHLNPFIIVRGANDSTVIRHKLQLDGPLFDRDGIAGTTGQVPVANADGTWNWGAGGGGGSVRISDLLDADADNTIDNLNFQQIWNWSTLEESALELNTTSTAASLLQTMLSINMSGAHSNSGQTSFGIRAENLHSGTTSVNYGGYFLADNAETNYGVHGEQVDGKGSGVIGLSSSNSLFSLTTPVAGVIAKATGNGTGLYCEAAGEPYLIALQNTVTTSDPGTAMLLYRRTSGTPAAGFGSQLQYVLESSTGVDRSAGVFRCLWRTATDGSRKSAFEFHLADGTGAGSLNSPLSLEGSGEIYAYGYDATPITGVPFRPIAHQTDGKYVSYTYDVMIDSLAAHGLTGGGGGDDWGSDVVNTDATLNGDGTSGSPLGVDTAILATLYDVYSTRAKHIKGATVKTPTSTENIGLFYTDHAITITRVSDAVLGTSPSVTYNLRFAANRNEGSPTDVFSSNRVVTSSSGATTTTFNDATIPANSWVWLITSATSGTVNDFTCTIQYRED